MTVYGSSNGEAYFNNALKRTTTTELTAKEIHEIGLIEVARIHNEMREIKEKVVLQVIRLSWHS